MSILSRRRARRQEQADRRAFEAKIRVSTLEHALELSSTDPDLDGLPRVRVVRNPNDALGWRPWVALGFPGEDIFNDFDGGYLGAHTDGGTQQECLRKTVDRLYGVYLARRETPLEVTG